jgi:hypothetical protein
VNLLLGRRLHDAVLEAKRAAFLLEAAQGSTEGLDVSYLGYDGQARRWMWVAVRGVTDGCLAVLLDVTDETEPPDADGLPRL